MELTTARKIEETELTLDRLRMVRGAVWLEKREALQKFYLFTQSSQPPTGTGIDWSVYPDLLAYLQSL